MELDVRSLGELLFWYNNLHKLPQGKCLSYTIPNVMILSDACDSGAAYVLLRDGVTSATVLNWSDYELGQCSAFREARAVEAGLQSFAPLISGKIVKVYTDNKALCSIVRNGSSVSRLQSIALRIWNMAAVNSVQMQIEWIPRDQNSVADYLSRLSD